MKPEDIPDVIIYKISVDGSNLGSRNCELVALTPMNLPRGTCNPCSYHSIFPLMLHEGKETREHLKEIISQLDPEMLELENQADLPTHNKQCTCTFKCCADFFALIKIMRPAKDEILEDGSKATSCTCALCGERRTTKVSNNREETRNPGWCSDLTQNVWNSIPTSSLQSSLFRRMPLNFFVFCILHMKVRVMGTLLKYLTRECERKGTAHSIAKEMRHIVRTFNITLKGDTIKSTGKKNTKAAKVSAMQGGQVDKIFECIRAHTMLEEERDEGEQEKARLWDQVLDATDLAADDTDTQVLAHFQECFSKLVQCYDLLNSKSAVTHAQLETYQILINELAKIWGERHGLVSVTPYLHIMFKHSYAYLKEYGSLRDWSQEAFEASHKRHKQLYAKTNYGGGKNGDPSSAFLQVLQKLYRRQFLERKIQLERSSTRDVYKQYMSAYRERGTRRAHKIVVRKSRAKKKAARAQR